MCCKRYSVKSVTDLTGEQIKEQDKLLDSMARPERLKEFKELFVRSKSAGGGHAAFAGGSGTRASCC
jgi:hypothetical protein